MATTTKFWVSVCHYQDWLDLLEVYASIIDTSKGSIMRDGLDLWVQTVNNRLEALPPDEAYLTTKHGQVTGDEFGTEL